MVALRNVAREARDLLQARIYRPAHFRVNFLDFLDLRTPPEKLHSNEIHIREAMAWLCRAQNATPDAGIAARYRLDKGWTTSYPETTGYIIPTFYNYAHVSGQPEYRHRAEQMACWLLTIQLDCGAFPGHTTSHLPQPRVFNTGQVMLGLLRAYRETGQPAFLEASRRAGDWLVAIQEPDGSWLKHTFCNRTHAYHTCVAWPLLELYAVTREPRYRRAAVQNLDWALSLQQPNGWFQNSGFRNDDQPVLHTIAYTITGLIESGALLAPKDPARNRYVQAALRASEALLHRFEIRRFMAGQFDAQWKSTVRYSCLTGNCQTAYNWLRLFQFTGDPRFLNGAMKLNDFVKSTQDLSSSHPGVRGGIKGSHPIWGNYVRFGYPNWAAKFFVDALMLEDKIVSLLFREVGIQ